MRETTKTAVRGPEPKQQWRVTSGEKISRSARLVLPPALCFLPTGSCLLPSAFRVLSRITYHVSRFSYQLKLFSLAFIHLHLRPCFLLLSSDFRLLDSAISSQRSAIRNPKFFRLPSSILYPLSSDFPLLASNTSHLAPILIRVHLRPGFLLVLFPEFLSPDF